MHDIDAVFLCFKYFELYFRSKPSLGWGESALDSSIDSASLTSRHSDGSRSNNSPRRSSAQAVVSSYRNVSS